MNIEELKAVLDIVNKEIEEQEEKAHFGVPVPYNDPYTGEGKQCREYFCMNNSEKEEWVKRLRNRGVLVTSSSPPLGKGKPYTAEKDKGVKLEGRGAAWDTTTIPARRG
jgi:hypothetical protein